METFKTTFRNEKGFSLLGATLSTTVLALGLIGTIQLMGFATKTNADTDLRVIATRLANEKAEVILADNNLQPQRYDYVISSHYPAENLSYGTTNNVFQRTVAITEVADDLVTLQSNSGLKKIDVMVSWGNETSEQVTISTLLTNYAN